MSSVVSAALESVSYTKLVFRWCISELDSACLRGMADLQVQLGMAGAVLCRISSVSDAGVDFGGWFYPRKWIKRRQLNK